mgnify:CR=1 FL=1
MANLTHTLSEIFVHSLKIFENLALNLLTTVSY